MEIKEILTCFSAPKKYVPTRALEAALAQRQAITPYLLAILESTASCYQFREVTRMDHIFALYLLAKFREKKAFPFVLKLASLPGGWPEKLLANCIVESLVRFIVLTYDSNLEAIKKVIEEPTVNQWSRNAALNSLLGLIAARKLERRKVIDYLRELFHSPLADTETFTTHLVYVAISLYPAELLEEINHAFEKDKVDLFVVDKKWVADMLIYGKEECLKQNVYNVQFHAPIYDVAKEICWMYELSLPKSKS